MRSGVALRVRIQELTCVGMLAKHPAAPETAHMLDDDL